MPRQHRTIPPYLRQRQSYSNDLRERVIYQSYVLKLKIHQISHVLNIPKRSVERVLHLWRSTGEVVPAGDGRKVKRSRVMDSEELEFLVSLLERNPDIYLDELQEQLAQQHGVVVGTSTIWDALKELGLTRKRLSCAAMERNYEQRARFKFLIGSESPERLVFIDESRIDLRTSYRMNGWSYKGTRARVKAKFQRGIGYSLLPALCSEGVIFSDIREGAYDGPGFIDYIECPLPHMNAWPAPRSVLVMDNCAIHHVEDVLPLCAAHGVRVYYLPPYSPDLNPIEEAFSFFKALLRRHGASFRAAVESKNRNAIYYEIHCILAMITVEKIKGWMGHSGYISVAMS